MFFSLPPLSNIQISVTASLILRPILKLDHSPLTAFVMQSGLLCLQCLVLSVKRAQSFLIKGSFGEQPSILSSSDGRKYFIRQGIAKHSVLDLLDSLVAFQASSCLDPLCFAVSEYLGIA
ncbi:hypothetical protein FGO68_gene7657 [Halteria grandinella]|uniref:Uncharacterized protein n=1 Tax=Halteria grandinella TaxID=5974 RepID=A0A8J8T0T0_HALGN|nr:hypothetical protein FGO68_gene7657 [Halteria grandinella]